MSVVGRLNEKSIVIWNMQIILESDSQISPDFRQIVYYFVCQIIIEAKCRYWKFARWPCNAASFPKLLPKKDTQHFFLQVIDLSQTIARLYNTKIAVYAVLMVFADCGSPAWQQSLAWMSRSGRPFLLAPRFPPPLDLWMKPPPARAASSPLTLSRVDDQRANTRAHVPFSNFDVSKFEIRASVCFRLKQLTFEC